MMTDQSFDWREVARFVLLSRELDELEERQLMPRSQPSQGSGSYSFPDS